MMNEMALKHFPLVPAEAGTQRFSVKNWIPASAGTSGGGIACFETPPAAAPQHEKVSVHNFPRHEEVSVNNVPHPEEVSVHNFPHPEERSAGPRLEGRKPRTTRRFLLPLREKVPSGVRGEADAGVAHA
jgi:hypothetical protein